MGNFCGLMTLGLAVAAVIGLVILCIRASAADTRCPDCRRLYALVCVGREVLERRKCYGLVTRRADSKGSGSWSGPGNNSGSFSTSGETSWQERVPIVQTTVRIYYKCR